MAVALTQLIPTQELPPGGISFIRKRITDAMVALAARELKKNPDELVARDIRWVGDLAAYGSGTTAATIEDWLFTTAATTVTGYVTVATGTMTDQRYVALFGIRDLRRTYDVKQAAATAAAVLSQVVSLIRLNVGGADKVIWDLSKCQGYPETVAGVCEQAVLIPPNTIYTISFYKSNGVASVIANVVLEGVVVEPRGLLISP